MKILPKIATVVMIQLPLFTADSFHISEVLIVLEEKENEMAKQGKDKLEGI